MEDPHTGDLTGTSLKVYRYMLKAGKPVRLAAVQRDLRMIGLSLAQYHAKKLVEMGLIREVQEGYVVEKVVIQNVFRIRRMLIPFQLAYAVFFSFTLLALVFLAWSIPFTAFSLIAIVVNVTALGISLYQMRQLLDNIA